MNRKGEMNFVGVLLVAFVVVVVGLALFLVVAQTVGQKTSSYDLVSTAVTPAAAGSSVDLTGQELFSLTYVRNESGADIDCSNNVSVAEGVSPRTGTKRVLMTSDSLISSVYCSSLNVSYSYGEEGYVDGAGRSIALLIPIMFALAVAVVGLVPAFRDSFMKMLAK